jgi:hypothetical protein
LNPKWPPIYKNPSIGAKFGFQEDYDVANWYPSLVCYSGHLESKMVAKILKSSDLDQIWFPNRLWCCELISIVGLLCWPFVSKMGANIQKSSHLEERERGVEVQNWPHVLLKNNAWHRIKNNLLI